MINYKHCLEMLGFGSNLPNLVSLLPSGIENLDFQVLGANNWSC